LRFVPDATVVHPERPVGTLKAETQALLYVKRSADVAVELPSGLVTVTSTAPETFGGDAAEVHVRNARESGAANRYRRAASAAGRRET
jgi:hypothetical protein